MIIIILISTIPFAQSIQTGIVSDSVSTLLHGANLIAIPDSDVLNMAFSISDENIKGCFYPILD